MAAPSTAPENSSSETPEKSGPPPSYHTVVSKTDLSIEPLFHKNKKQSTTQSNTPIHECCCYYTNDQFINNKIMCKSCGKEIETKYSSPSMTYDDAVDYCDDCTSKTDTSISIHQTRMNYVIEFKLVDDEQIDFLSSTSTLISSTQRELVSPTIEVLTTSMPRDFTNQYINVMTITLGLWIGLGCHHMILL